MRFVPDKPLAYNTGYQATLKAGAKDAKLVAATTKDLAWSFTTVQAAGRPFHRYPPMAQRTPRRSATPSRSSLRRRWPATI